MKLESIIKKSDWYYVNDNLTTKNFPKPEKIETEGYRIIKMSKTFSSEEALAEIKRQGCRPANAWELAGWANTHREEMEKETVVVAFGQLWQDSYDDRRVPCVLAYSDGDLNFNLVGFRGDWDSDNFLLAFSDQTLDTQNIEKSSDSLTLEQRVTRLEGLFNSNLLK